MKSKNDKEWKVPLNCNILLSVPGCKRVLDGELNSVFGRIFTKNYGKIKSGFISPLAFWLRKLLLYFILITYDFEKVIISRNYFS